MGKYVVLLSGSWGFKRERHMRSTISEIADINFEDTMMPAPKNFHLFLSEQYGDYMTLPPAESRELRHTVKIDFGIYE